MVSLPSWLPLFLPSVFLPVTAAFSQSSPPLTPPAVVQEKVREWVRVQETISAEESRWKEEQQTLRDLNELRRREIQELDEAIATSRERVQDFEDRKARLTAEQAGLRTSRDQLQRLLGPLETQARALLPTLPPPLRKSLGDTLSRLENPVPDAPLQNRYRDVLAVLTGAANFHRQITLHSELRQAGGTEIEVQVLYLGLARAYYVDRTGRHAGTGVPGEGGWLWTEAPQWAEEIRRAISVHQKEAPPSLVRLPVQVSP